MAVLRVKQSFAAGYRVYQQGELVDDADPIIAGREALFDAPAPTYPAKAEKRTTARKAKV